MRLHRLMWAVPGAGWTVLAHAAETPDPAAPSSLLQITLSLVLIIAILVGASVLFKKFGLNRYINNPNFPVKVIGAISIGNNQRLVVIEAGDQWVVLGVTAHQISQVATMPRQELPGAAAPGQPGFSSWMQAALEKYHGKQKP